MQALTPGYSSPEQILGKQITTASDVYSLGVVLYLLLTGRSPYRSAINTAEDAIREVCETEPQRPSTATAAPNVATRERLDRDLDAIVLMALRKEPERRYASVELLSEDIRRHLDGLRSAPKGTGTVIARANSCGGTASRRPLPSCSPSRSSAQRSYHCAKRVSQGRRSASQNQSASVQSAILRAFAALRMHSCSACTTLSRTYRVRPMPANFWSARRSSI